MRALVFACLLCGCAAPSQTSATSVPPKTPGLETVCEGDAAPQQGVFEEEQLGTDDRLADGGVGRPCALRQKPQDGVPY